MKLLKTLLQVVVVILLLALPQAWAGACMWLCDEWNVHIAWSIPAIFIPIILYALLFCKDFMDE